jgi:hypothetical protein
MARAAVMLATVQGRALSKFALKIAQATALATTAFASATILIVVRTVASRARAPTCARAMVIVSRAGATAQTASVGKTARWRCVSTNACSACEPGFVGKDCGQNAQFPVKCVTVCDSDCLTKCQKNIMADGSTSDAQSEE